MKREREVDRVTQMTIYGPSALDLSRIIRAQIGQPQRVVTCVHEDHRKKVHFETLDLNDPERMSKILEQLDALSPDTEILDKTIVHDPSIERRTSLRLETDINGDTWKIHLDPDCFTRRARREVTRYLIFSDEPREMLFVTERHIQNRITHKELTQARKLRGPSRRRYLDTVADHMLRFDEVVLQVPRLTTR